MNNISRPAARPSGILCLLFLAVAAAAAPAQTRASVDVALSEQGKPVPGGLVVLQRIKDAGCLKFFESREVSPKAMQKWEASATDLPWSKTDANGKYGYQ